MPLQTVYAEEEFHEFRGVPQSFLARAKRATQGDEQVNLVNNVPYHGIQDEPLRHRELHEIIRYFPKREAGFLCVFAFSARDGFLAFSVPVRYHAFTVFGP